MKKSILLSIAFIFFSLPAFAGSEGGAGAIFLFADNFTIFPVSEPYVPGMLPDKISFQRPSVGAMIMGGVLGNILGSLTGVLVGARMSSGDEDNLGPIFLGWGVGSAFGSAMGVSLAGHSRYWRGDFGMAMLGGILGSGLAFCLASLTIFESHAAILSFASILLAPPIGAAILYNSSMRPRRLPAGNALLNISAGRLGLGVPDVRVWPIFAPGCGSKPKMQFNVNILSVEI